MQGNTKKVEAIRAQLEELKVDKVYANFAALELYQMLHDTASKKEKAIIVAAVVVRKRRLTDAMRAQVDVWKARDAAQEPDDINGELV